jgi:hypothetical protein
MERFLKKQFAAQNRGTAMATRPTGDALYAGCAPQTANRGAHALTRVRELASQGPCWEGYHRDYSKKEGANDSCVKDGGKKKKGKKKKKARGAGAQEKKKGGEGDASSSASSSSDSDGGGDGPKTKKAKKDCGGKCE